MTIAAPALHEVRRPASIEEAVAALHELGPDAIPLAGATWVMRSAQRGRRYVALGGVRELRHPVSADERADRVTIGATATHTDLAREDPLRAHGAVNGLNQAARYSAFPQVRNVATVAGNLCARGFAEADLVPALLAADATVLTATAGRRSARPVVDHLSGGSTLAELVVGLEIPTPPGRGSGFARLTVRGSGEYAIANVAVSVDLNDEGLVAAARVAVGAVEPVPRLCLTAAEVLVGRAPDARAAGEAGNAAAADLRSRDGLDAPGWYRLAVLPALFRTALARAVAATHHAQEST